MQEGIHEVADFALQGGDVLRPARVAFATWGTLSPARDNAILFPTWFSSAHEQNAWLIGPGRALDPARWFIICPDLLGNGRSSSPSNTPAPFDRGRFPRISGLDNVRLQERLITERWGITRLQLVIGRSMGAQCAFQWASWFPDRVARVLPFSGSAGTTPHNYVFLDGVKAALTADQRFAGGDYTAPPSAGLHAVGRLYAGWALSQAFYRDGLHLADDPDVDTYLAKRWEPNFARRDANDLLCQLGTWQRFDVAGNDRHRGDLAAALGAIKAPAIVMPCRTDLYFPPEDSAAAVALMPRAELRVIDSVWGHRAGGPGSPAADIAAVEAAARALLDGPPAPGMN